MTSIQCSRNRPMIAGALALALAGCAADPRPAQAESPADWTPHTIRDDPKLEPPAPARFKNPIAARYHMRRHFDDLRMVERLLIAGRLEEGRALAYLLVRQTDDPGMAAWDEQSRSVADAARELFKAPSMDEALRRVARVAVACAECHLAAQSLPVFAPPPALPPDRQTWATRMARHAWAADRLWEGLAGADDARWSRGLAVLSDTPLPFTALTGPTQLANDLQARARKQLDLRTTTVGEDRGTAYGEMLVLCAACHLSLRRGRPLTKQGDGHATSHAGSSER